MEESEVSAAIGEDGFGRLVAAFYRRVREDDLLAPLYPEDDWVGAEDRLRGFLVFRFGGSDKYIQERGHPRLGIRHAPFAIGVPERDRWMKLMGEALDESELPDTAEKILRPFFGQVAEFLRSK